MCFVMLIHSIYTHLFTGSVSEMSEACDSQNKSEGQANLIEGTSPSSSYDEGSRSTPRNLPKAATRQRKKKSSECEDQDFVAKEVTSKKKVLKKVYGTTASTKPGLKQKAPARRIPMSKPRKVPNQQRMQFTIEQSDDDDEAAE